MKKICWIFVCLFASLSLFFCSIKPPWKDRDNFEDYGWGYKPITCKHL